MSEWKRVRLENLVSIVTGKRDVNFGSPNGQYPFFTCAREVHKCDSFSFDCDAILLAGNCDIGNIQRYKGKFEAYQRTYVLQSTAPDVASLDYIWNCIRLDWVRYNKSKMFGAAIPYIRINTIKEFPISLPPRPIQDRIAGILSDYDSAIANCRKQIALLEEAAMRLYREWFKDGKGEKKKLCDVCDILYGKPHKDIPDGNIPIYGSAGIMRYGNKAKFAEESVLIPRKGTLDNVMYVDDPFWVVDTMFYTRFKIGHMAKIAFYQLAKLKMSNMNTGTAVPSMTTETLYKLDLIVPPEELRKRFDELVSKLFSAKKKCLQQIRTLTEARDRLLPKLMKGEIAV